MRDLWQRHARDTKAVVAAYAKAEAAGFVDRRRNTHGIDAMQYARALLRDGLRRGWLNKAP